jgi:hypothetical protein
MLLLNYFSKYKRHFKFKYVTNNKSIDIDTITSLMNMIFDRFQNVYT